MTKEFAHCLLIAATPASLDPLLAKCSWIDASISILRVGAHANAIAVLLAESTLLRRSRSYSSYCYPKSVEPGGITE